MYHRLQSTRSPHLPFLAALVAASLVYHTVLYVCGLRFIGGWDMHCLDAEILRTDLLRSCWYLHSQPPLFNLFIGLLLKQPLTDYATALYVCNLVFGLVTVISLYLAQAALGISRIIAAVSSVLLMASPSMILYESVFDYTVFLACLFSLSAWLLCVSVQKPSFVTLSLFFLTLAAIGATRSLIHISYFVLVVGLLAIFWRSHRRLVVLASLIPCLLLLSIYLKNYLLFNKFAASTWLGMNYWDITGTNLTPDDLNHLVKTGTLSDIALTPSFQPLDRYPDRLKGTQGFADVPALTQPCKANGQKNLNHIAYIAIADEYMANSLKIVRHHPQAFLIGLGRAWWNYFKSAAAYQPLKPNQDYIFLTPLFDVLVGKVEMPGYGKRVHASRPGSKSQSTPSDQLYAYLVLLVGLPVLWIHGVLLAMRPSIFKNQQKVGLVTGFIVFTILYVSFFGNFFDVGQNNRFRFIVDPLYVILLGLLLERASRWYRNRSPKSGTGTC